MIQVASVWRDVSAASAGGAIYMHSNCSTARLALTAIYAPAMQYMQIHVHIHMQIYALWFLPS